RGPCSDGRHEESQLGWRAYSMNVYRLHGPGIEIMSAFGVDPSSRTRMMWVSPSHFVKGFGYRPMRTIAAGAGAVSESLQGKNPRDVEKGARCEVYGELKFVMGAARCASIERVGR